MLNCVGRGKLSKPIGREMIELVDTNIIVRLLVGDDKSLQKKAIGIFKQAELGERTLMVKSVVVAEACFVLESFYKKSKEEIAGVLKVFINQKWLVIKERKILNFTWQWYLQGFHFVDSYLLATAKVNQEKILTFDKKLQKIAA